MVKLFIFITSLILMITGFYLENIKDYPSLVNFIDKNYFFKITTTESISDCPSQSEYPIWFHRLASVINSEIPDNARVVTNTITIPGSYCSGGVNFTGQITGLLSDGTKFNFTKEQLKALIERNFEAKLPVNASLLLWLGALILAIQYLTENPLFKKESKK